jgi:hypothetical protein
MTYELMSRLAQMVSHTEPFTIGSAATMVKKTVGAYCQTHWLHAIC